MSFNPQIDKIFSQWRGKDSPGMAVAVRLNDKVIHKAAYGKADLGRGIDNTPATVFHCGSLAKQFTAMSLLLLAAKKRGGKPIVDLDDDARKHIEEMKHLPKITIRHLLHHTSGIRDMLTQLTLAGWRWGDDAMTRDDVLRLVSQMQSLNFQPGERWSYSNTNYFLAGEIVSRASGMSLADFARKNIFEPLDMASTRFVNTYSEIVEKRAYGYRQRDGSDSFETRIPNYDLTGPTNLFTTVEDLLKWDQNFKSQIVGGPLALAALQKPGPKSEGYGLGLFVAADQDDEPRLIWHDGRTIGYRAHFFRHNHDRVSIALLCNVQFPDLLATDRLVYIISRVAQGRQPPPPIIEPRAPPPIREHTTGPALEEYCGTYNSSEIEATFELTTDGSSLVLDRQKYPRTILKRVGDDTFVADNNTLSDVLREVEFTFLRNGKGSISGFRLDWSHRIPLSRLMNFPFVKQK